MARCDRCDKEADVLIQICPNCRTKLQSANCPLYSCKHKEMGAGICSGVTLKEYRFYDKNEGEIVAMVCDGYEIK
ncbi:hypothetical protein M0R72_13320 [Candidatus Pacearchaeota archaeon]|nr:hypothetical protein [Candidatus Pacearchaeota archaeon]